MFQVINFSAKGLQSKFRRILHFKLRVEFSLKSLMW